MTSPSTTALVFARNPSRERRPVAPPQATGRHLSLTARTHSAAAAAAARFFSVMFMALILGRATEND